MNDLGKRYKCYQCETKFYDLNKPLPLCPSCGEDQNNRVVSQPYKRSKKRSFYKSEPEIRVVPEEDEDLAEVEESGPLTESGDDDAAIEAADEDEPKDEPDLEDEEIVREETCEGRQESWG